MALPWLFGDVGISFFDRKRQRDILIEKKKYKRRMRNPPTKEN